MLSKLAVISALLVPLCIGAIGSAHAGLMDDPDIMAMKIELMKAAQSGTSAAVAQRQASDTAAKASQQCADIAQSATDAAKAYIDRNRPPDPTSIIQNTTCHVDISTVKIPVIMTGLPFLDGLVSNYIQKYLNGACTKGQNFLADLQKNALDQLNSATGGAVNSINGVLGGSGAAAASSVFNYATSGKLDLAAVQAQGNAAVNGLINSATQNAPTSLSAATGLSGNAGQQATVGVNQAASSATAALCQYGIPNDQSCPACVVNPMSPSCIGPKPFCGQVAGVAPPYCVNPSNGVNGN